MNNHEKGHQEPRQVRPVQLVGGIVLGWVLCWFVFAVVLFGLYARYGDSSSPLQVALAVLGLVGLPVVLGAMLLSPRTRHWGAGLFMGLAIGAMTGAGVCAGFIGLNAV